MVLLVRHWQGAGRVADVVELAATFIGKGRLHRRGHIRQPVERFAFRSGRDREQGVARLLFGILLRHEARLHAVVSPRGLKGPSHPRIILLERRPQRRVRRHLRGRERRDEVLQHPGNKRQHEHNDAQVPDLFEVPQHRGSEPAWFHKQGFDEMAEAPETQPLLPDTIRRHGMKGFDYERDRTGALFLLATLQPSQTLSASE